jgi:hypothetical protein
VRRRAAGRDAARLMAGYGPGWWGEVQASGSAGCGPGWWRCPVPGRSRAAAIVVAQLAGTTVALEDFRAEDAA